MESLDDLAALVNRSVDKGAESFRAAGEALIRAKSLVRHGEWMNWLSQNIRLSRQHAGRLMRAARAGRTTEGVLDAMALGDGIVHDEIHATSNGTKCSILERNENRPTVQNGHTNGHLNVNGHRPTIYVEEPIEIPFDDPPAPAPEPAKKPAPTSRWAEFTPNPRAFKPEDKRTSIDEVKSALSRLSRRLTIWINETPEGQRFADYVVKKKLNWIDHQDITVKGRTYGKRFIGLRAIRRLVALAMVPKHFSADRITELWAELDPEGEE